MVMLTIRANVSRCLVFFLLVSSLESTAHAQISTTGAAQVSIGAGGTAPAVTGTQTEPFTNQVAGAPNGDFVLFSTVANNIVAAGTDQNLVTDIYKYSPTAGMELISLVPSTGKAPTTGFQGATDPAVSPLLPDGSYAVAFASDATDLVTNYAQTAAGSNSAQIYVRLPSLNQNVLVSKGVSATGQTGAIGANQGSSHPALALLGTSPTRYLVAFSSYATNIGTSGVGSSQFERIFTAIVTVKDGTATCSDPELLFDPTDGELRTPQLSGDGRFLVFSSGATILKGISSNTTQIYSYDRSAKSFQLISKTSSNQPGNGFSDRPSVSYQGNFIVFRTGASDIVPNDENVVFVRYDRTLGTYSQVNTSSAGTQSNGRALHAAIHPNGRFVAFSDSGTNLVTTSVSSTQSYFKDINSGEVILASQNSSGAPGDGFNGSGSEDSSYDFCKVSIGAGGFTTKNAFVPFISSSVNLAKAGTPSASNTFAFSAPITLPARRLSQGALIESPPDVVITKVLSAGRGARVRFLFTSFEVDDTAFLSSQPQALATGTTLKYSLEVRKVGARQRIQRLTSRNSATINRLSPGRYSVRYRVIATKGRKTIRSKFSPKTSLVVPKA